MRLQLTIIMLLLTGVAGYAQQSEKEQALKALGELANLYRQPEGLSFDLVYRYANENAPAVYLDSIHGQFKLNGNRYWYKIDRTESVSTGDYLILLFAEDNIMYLAKPSQNAAMANPVAMLDSLLARNDHVACTMETRGDMKIIRLDFPDGSPCKRVEYHIDRETGYMVRMSTTVRSEQLYESAARPLVEGPATYAIVEAAFTGYRRGGIDSNLFDPGRYFKMEGDAFVTVAPFHNYRVFIGTPGLGGGN